MKWICLASAAAVAALAAVCAARMRQRRRSDNIVCRLSGSRVLIVFSFITALAQALFAFDEGGSAALLPLSALAAFSMIFLMNDVIVFDGDGFEKHGIFGNTQRYSYADITAVSHLKRELKFGKSECYTVFRVGERNISVAENSTNFDRFMHAAFPDGVSSEGSTS